MPNDICKLCLQAKPLQDSHLLPAAAFRYLRAGSDEPILGRWGAESKHRVLLQTSKQIHDYLLCAECEHRLNIGGERWILSRLAEQEASPLFYALRGLTPIVDEMELKAYSTASLPEFDVDKIVHFALGVFFKSAVHHWTVEKQKRKLMLGPYRESLRKYLLGGDFPKACALMLTIHPPSGLSKILCFPYQWNISECHTYSFCLVGLEFVISLGKQIPEWLRMLSFATNPGRPVVVTDHTLRIVSSRSLAIRQSGGIKGKLRKRLSPQTDT